MIQFYSQNLFKISWNCMNMREKLPWKTNKKADRNPWIEIKEVNYGGKHKIEKKFFNEHVSMLSLYFLQNSVCKIAIYFVADYQNVRISEQQSKFSYFLYFYFQVYYKYFKRISGSYWKCSTSKKLEVKLFVEGSFYEMFA